MNLTILRFFLMLPLILTFLTGEGQTASPVKDKSYKNTVTDIDGNIYQTIKIGNQIWMTENLNVTRYNDSTEIPLKGDVITWANLTTPGMCWFDNDQVNCTGNKFGALYNWYAVSTGKLCPAGWHVPADEEWTTLIEFLDPKNKLNGAKLKATGTTHWSEPNKGATNESGFSALPGGFRQPNGIFERMGFEGSWWSSTQYASLFAWHRNMYHNYSTVNREKNDKNYGASVRCVKD